MILFMDGCNIIKKQNNTYLNSGSPVSSGSGTSSRSAGKSLLKTKVVSYLNGSSSLGPFPSMSLYFGFVSPLGLVTPGQSGLVGSNSGRSSSVTFSTWWQYRYNQVQPFLTSFFSFPIEHMGWQQEGLLHHLSRPGPLHPMRGHKDPVPS